MQNSLERRNLYSEIHWITTCSLPPKRFFRTAFGIRDVPSKPTILLTNENCTNNGPVLSESGKTLSAPRTDVRNRLLRYPQKSLHQFNHGEISKSSPEHKITDTQYPTWTVKSSVLPLFQAAIKVRDRPFSYHKINYRAVTHQNCMRLTFKG